MARADGWTRLRRSLLCLSALAALGIGPQARAAAPLQLGTVLGDADAGYQRATRPGGLVFPRDHGAHPQFRSEWWYLTATLTAADGREFGLQFTLFRQALRPRPVIGGPWDASQLYLAHVALTDVAAGRHQQDERLSRGHPRLAGVSAAPFRAWLDDWTLTAAGDGLDSLTLRVDARGFAAELELTAQTPIVLQGDRGLSRKGPGQASYYYSLPRLAVAGRLTAAGVAYPVTGAAWLDREWSTSVLGDDQQGWDWFALHLEGQQDVMVYRLRRTDGARDPYDQGVWLDGGGRPQPLRAQDFTLTPQRWWTDGDGVRWPVAWDLAVLVPGGPRLLRVDAAVDDQRMDTLLRYWEGLVHVRDDSGRLVGRGYMELTGYE